MTTADDGCRGHDRRHVEASTTHTHGDRVAFAESVQTKLMESTALGAQAAARTAEQFANSPYLRDKLLNAIIATMEAHSSMSRQALKSEVIQPGLLAVLLGPVQLWQGPQHGDEAGTGHA